MVLSFRCSNVLYAELCTVFFLVQLLNLQAYTATNESDMCLKRDPVCFLRAVD